MLETIRDEAIQPGKVLRRQILHQEADEDWAYFHLPVTFEDSKQLGEVVMVGLKPFDWILQEGKCNFGGKSAHVSTAEEAEGKAACCGENSCVDCWLEAFANIERYERIVTHAVRDQVCGEVVSLMG